MLDISKLTNHLDWKLFPLPMQLYDEQLIANLFFKHNDNQNARSFKLEFESEQLGEFIISGLMNNNIISLRIESSQELHTDLENEIKDKLFALADSLKCKFDVNFQKNSSSKLLPELLQSYFLGKALDLKL